jgi:hypothetical protein
MPDRCGRIVEFEALVTIVVIVVLLRLPGIV